MQKNTNFLLGIVTFLVFWIISISVVALTKGEAIDPLALLAMLAGGAFGAAVVYGIIHIVRKNQKSPNDES